MTTQSQNPIGNLILNPSQIPNADPSWGELSDAERLVYGLLLGMYARKQPIDLMSVTVALQDQEWLEQVGGQQVLAQWVEDAL